MSSWGPGIFENDHVMDWLVKLECMPLADDIVPILNEAFDWVIEHHEDPPGYVRYGDFSEAEPDQTLILAAFLQHMKKLNVKCMNKDKPGAYLKWDRRFDFGAAAAEIVAILAGHPMPSLLVFDQLTQGHADISKVTNSRPEPSGELLDKAAKVLDVVLARDELYERWVTEDVAIEWKENVMNLKLRLQMCLYEQS